MVQFTESGMTDEQKKLAFMEAYSAAPERITREAVNILQKAVGQGNASRGFHDEGDQLREQVTRVHPYAEGAVAPRAAALRNYYMVKLGLIITEAAEALEDLRNGRPVDQNYYTENGVEVVFSDDARGNPLKPEGVPSEIADIVIRCLDFADEAGFSLIDAIYEKLDYNDTRSRLHGKTV